MALSERTSGRAPRGPRRPVFRWIKILLLIAGVATLTGGAAVGVAALWALTILPRSLPPVTALETLQPIEGSKIYDDNDELVTELSVEKRIFVQLSQIPQSLRDAILATEDRRFYSHWGVDPIGIGRAVFQNYRRGRIVEGGSTITQQLTKLLFLTPDKSLERKLKEAVLAFELERRYTKDRILEMYLNQIYFGHGAYGVEAAARTYFGKSVSEINVREAALLAGLPKAPANYSPFERPEVAKRRRDLVIRSMVEFGALKGADAQRLARADLGVIPPERRRTTGQYFLEYVSQTLEAKYGADLVFKGGLHVYTTLNRQLQLDAEQAVREGLKALEGRSAKARPGEQPEGALISVEPHTGYVRAIVGGYDFARSEFNRAVYAKRQPGSGFKPFVYLAALESGLTPATRVDDQPVSYAVGQNGNAWKPENYDRKFRGSITLQQALEESVNVVTVKLQERVGIGKTVGVARRLGIGSPLTSDLTLALGTSDVTLLEMTSAYSALANQGLWLPPTTVRYVTDGQGKLLEEHVPHGKQVVTPEIAYVATHMLRGVVERGTGQAAKALGRPVAAKTGTTNDYSNAWFIGYTPTLATGVWVGYDRPKSLGRDETGSRVAVPIWLAYMKRALGNSPVEDFPIPEQVTLTQVDLDASNECVRPVTMAFVRGTEPTLGCGARRQAVPVSPSAMPGFGAEEASSGLPVGPTTPPAVPSAPGSSGLPAGASGMPFGSSAAPVNPSTSSFGPSAPSVGPSAPSVGPSAPPVGPSAPSVGPSAPSVGPSAAPVNPSTSSFGPSAPPVGPSALPAAPAGPPPVSGTPGAGSGALPAGPSVVPAAPRAALPSRPGSLEAPAPHGNAAPRSAPATPSPGSSADRRPAGADRQSP